MAKPRYIPRGQAKPAAVSDCTLAAHQDLARTTQFKVCPHCGEPLEAHRRFPVEPIGSAAVSQALTSMVSEDERFISTASDGIKDFLRGVAGFFLTAGEIEKSAKYTLAEFKTFTRPTNLDEDQVLVSKIRSASVEYDVAKAHWDPVASLFNNLHKRITGGRKRTLDLIDEALRIGNGHHNAYEDEARRKAREEEDRIRRENERRAEEQRDREVREMEEKALRAEADSESLSERERVFVDLVARQNYPPHVAATRAGFSKTNNGADTANRLMGLVKVVNAIKGIREATQIRTQAKAVAAAPLETAPVERVKPEVATSGRATRSVEVYDPKAFMAALLDPTQRLHYGIPAELATWDQPKLNQQGRALDEQINRWPGCRLVVDRTVV